MIEYVAGSALIAAGTSIVAAAVSGDPGSPVTWSMAGVGSAIVSGAVYLFRWFDKRNQTEQQRADQANRDLVAKLEELAAKLAAELERERQQGRERAAADRDRYDSDVAAVTARAESAERRLDECLHMRP